MNIAAQLIEKFGGLTSMSRVLGHKHCTTVQGWRDSGSVPSWRWPEILQAAKREGVDVSEEYTLAVSDKGAVDAA